MAIVAKCTCKADRQGNPQGATFQDETYGGGNRVFNLLRPDKAKQVARCTVCGREIEVEPVKA